MLINVCVCVCVCVVRKLLLTYFEYIHISLIQNRQYILQRQIITAQFNP